MLLRGGYCKSTILVADEVSETALFDQDRSVVL